MYAHELPQQSTPLCAALTLLCTAYADRPILQDTTAHIRYLYEFYHLATDPRFMRLHVFEPLDVVAFLAREIAPNRQDNDWIVQTMDIIYRAHTWQPFYREYVEGTSKASAVSTPTTNWAERSVIPLTPEEERENKAFWQSYTTHQSALQVNDALAVQKLQEVRLQRQLGSWALIVVSAQLIITNIVMVAFFVVQLVTAQTIPDAVLIAWMTTCFAEVLGILWVIARSLYPRRDNTDSQLQAVLDIEEN